VTEAHEGEVWVSMTIPKSDSPLRIGLVGLGPGGAHHLERISLRTDMRVVAAWDDGENADRARALFPNTSPRLVDLLVREDLDWILIAAPLAMRAELAIRALDEWKQVAVEAPPCVNHQQASQLVAEIQRPGRGLYVLPTRRDGFDFRAALHTVAAGTLGTVQSARITSWAKAVPPDFAEAARDPTPAEVAPGDGVFTFFAYQYVDQLLQLVRRRPCSVFARITHPPATDPTATAFFLSIAFDEGGDAVIDVNLHAGAALHTGWMLAGSAGAYCQQRTYLTEPSGEVCDMPITPADLPPFDLYAELLRTARLESNCFKSAEDAATVMRVIDAARLSDRTGGVVTLFEVVG
jgi:predicted dehydrogenase